MRITYFRGGNPVADSGVLVLRRLNAAKSPRKVRYDVRLVCCGSEEVLTHYAISRRRNRGVAARRLGNRIPVCSKCRYREKMAAHRKPQEAPPLYGVVMPPWPVPALALPRGWLPR